MDYLRPLLENSHGTSEEEKCRAQPHNNRETVAVGVSCYREATVGGGNNYTEYSILKGEAKVVYRKSGIN